MRNKTVQYIQVAELVEAIRRFKSGFDKLSHLV